MSNTNMTKEQYIASLRPGSKVSFLLPAGGKDFTRKTGKVVFAEGTHVVVNMGGRYGTPAVVAPENVILPRE